MSRVNLIIGNQSIGLIAISHQPMGFRAGCAYSIPLRSLSLKNWHREIARFLGKTDNRSRSLNGLTTDNPFGLRFEQLVRSDIANLLPHRRHNL